MSLARAIRRRRARKNGTPWPGKPTAYEARGEGYLALHPTKGWRLFSASRLRAQARLRAMAELINKRMRQA